jgi:competence CoiA-like predicted nuclease
MLEAKRTDTQQVVKLWKLDDGEVRQLMHEVAEKRELFTCFYSDCGCNMYIKALDSQNVVTHFARYPKTGDETYHPKGAGESEEHLKAKSALATWLQRRYPFAEITTEKVIETMAHKDQRRIDVFLTFPDGGTEAHEIQRTAQNTARTERRTNDYKSAGIDSVVWWWLDEKAKKETVINWCIANCSQYGIIKSKYIPLMGRLILSGFDVQLYDCELIKQERIRRAAAAAAIYEKKRKEEEERWAEEQRLRRLRVQAAETERKNQIAQKEKEKLAVINRYAKNWHVGREYPTSFGGRATVTAYDEQSDRYITKTGLTWVFDDDVLKMPPECMP